MNKIFKSVGKFLIGLFAFGATFATPVSAAENNIDAMQAFREAMTNSSVENKIFREDILFIVPAMQGELDFLVTTDDKTLKTAGEFLLWLTDSSGNTSDVEVPFYLTQNEKDMQLYFQVDKKWHKFQVPSIAAVTADKVATPTALETEDLISDVKEVVLLQESDTRRTMLVKLDGNKIADEMKAESEKNPADNGTADDKEFHDGVMNYLESGLRSADIWYTWTVDKTNWQTLTMSWNLSNLVQAVAQAALNDPSKNWSEIERDILETVAFYSEAKAYTTVMNQDAAKLLEIPKNVIKKAKPVDDMIPGKK